MHWAFLAIRCCVSDAILSGLTALGSFFADSARVYWKTEVMLQKTSRISTLLEIADLVRLYLSWRAFGRNPSTGRPALASTPRIRRRIPSSDCVMAITRKAVAQSTFGGIRQRHVLSNTRVKWFYILMNRGSGAAAVSSSNPGILPNHSPGYCPKRQVITPPTLGFPYSYNPDSLILKPLWN